MSREAWRQISLDSYRAAKLLQEQKRWRSSVSRSYYAAYCSVAGELEGKAHYPHGIKNPPHESLPDLVMTYLTTMSFAKRRQLASTLVRLFRDRVDADYRPMRIVDRSTAALATVAAYGLLRSLGVTP